MIATEWIQETLGTYMVLSQMILYILFCDIYIYIYCFFSLPLRT